jgi:hypothetical protein
MLPGSICCEVENGWLIVEILLLSLHHEAQHPAYFDGRSHTGSQAVDASCGLLFLGLPWVLLHTLAAILNSRSGAGAPAIDASCGLLRFSGHALSVVAHLGLHPQR